MEDRVVTIDEAVVPFDRVMHARDDGTFVVVRNGRPYHVTREDPLFDAVSAAANLLDLEPEPPPPEPVWRPGWGPGGRAPDSITKRQIILGLLREGWITPAEADAWAGGTALPALILGAVAGLDEAERVEARVTAFTMSEARLDDPLLRAAARAAMPELDEGAVAAALAEAFARWAAL